MSKISESEINKKERDLTSQLELYWHDDWYIHHSGQILHVIDYGDIDDNENDEDSSYAARLPSNLTLIPKPKSCSHFILPIYVEEEDNITYYKYDRHIRLSDIERLIGKISHKYKLDNTCFYEQPLTWETIDGVRCLIIAFDTGHPEDNTRIGGMLKDNDVLLQNLEAI